MPTGTLTISQYTAAPTAEIDVNSLLEVRGWYNRSFISVDGVTPVFGNTSSGTEGPYYFSTTPTLNTSGALVVPAHEVQITVGANPTGNYFEGLWVDGAFSQLLMPNNNVTSGWQIPSTYGDPIAYDEIATYNRAKRLVYAPDTYFTADQVIQEIRRLAGNFDYMAVSVNGIGSASFPPVVASEPIVLMENDPKVGSWINILAYFADTGNTAAQNTVAVTNAMTAAALTSAGLYIPVGTFPINTISITVPVVFAPGASILRLANGQTVTMTKAVSADVSKHFDNALAGQGTVSFAGNTSLLEVYPDWWVANTTPGTTDMTTAINAAQVALPSTGGTVRFLGTTYKTVGADASVTGFALQITKSNVTFLGEPGATLTFGNHTCIDIVGSNAVIDGLTLTGAGANTADTGARAIRLAVGSDGATIRNTRISDTVWGILTYGNTVLTNLTVQNCNVQNIVQRGIYFLVVDGGNIVNNYLERCGLASNPNRALYAGYAVSATSSNRIKIAGNEINAGAGTYVFNMDVRSGIVFNDARDCSATGNTIRTWTNAIFGENCLDVIIDGNNCRTLQFDNAIELQASGNNESTRNVISNNTVHSEGTDGPINGIVIGATAPGLNRYTVVSGNTVFGARDNGIAIQGPCTNNVAIGNILMNNGRVTAGSAGIYLSGQADRNLISANHSLDDGAGAGRTQDYGVRIDAPVTNTQVQGNFLYNNKTAAVLNNGTTSSFIANTGTANIDVTVTPAGTAGAQTINMLGGSVNFAALATSLVVTNSLVTDQSVINATVATNDATMKGALVVATAGSFTIFATPAAPTAETRVNFTIVQ